METSMWGAKMCGSCLKGLQQSQSRNIFTGIAKQPVLAFSCYLKWYGSGQKWARGYISSQWVESASGTILNWHRKQNFTTNGKEKILFKKMIQYLSLTLNCFCCSPSRRDGWRAGSLGLCGLVRYKRAGSPGNTFCWRARILETQVPSTFSLPFSWQAAEI